MRMRPENIKSKTTELEKELIDLISSELEPYFRSLHSIVLIGSRAKGAEEEGSDIDVVVICKRKSRDEISRHLWDMGIKETDNKIQYICFDPGQVKRVFQMGSPLAFAIINGEIIKDDGYLKRLFKISIPSVPTGDYYIYALEELIAMWYFDTLLRFERDIRKSHSPEGFCAARGRCEGHSPADMLASVVMRLLYVTLPARGYNPLNKKDVSRFSVIVYGDNISQVIEKVAYLHRNNVIWITFDEYKLIKPFAVMLFKEALKIIGREESVKILKKVSSIMKMQEPR